MNIKSNQVQQILAGNVKMDTCTSFFANGDINIHPCPWESDKQVTSGGRRQSMGRMIIEEDGTSHFRAYRFNSGSRYTHIYLTENGELKRTRTALIVKVVLPLGIGRFKIIKALTSQVQEIVNYIRSLQDNTCGV